MNTLRYASILIFQLLHSVCQIYPLNCFLTVFVLEKTVFKRLYVIVFKAELTLLAIHHGG